MAITQRYNPKGISFTLNVTKLLIIIIVAFIIVLFIQNIKSVSGCVSQNNPSPFPPPDSGYESETDEESPPDMDTDSEQDIVVPPDPESEEEEDEEVTYNELDKFHKFFKDTLSAQFSQKAEKVAFPTNVWHSETVFVNMQPFSNVSNFGTMCHVLIGYAVRFNNPNDVLYQDSELAQNLCNSLLMIDKHLPNPPPHQSAPWGAIADWYHFSITMPEVFMTITAVLSDTKYFDLCTDLTLRVFDLYLPTATSSLGWVRTAGNAMRMGVPYVYGQMLRGVSLMTIGEEASVQDVKDIIAFPFVEQGNGLHVDAIYVDHIDVRAYGYLINSYFTFNYYIYYFGSQVLNEVGLREAIIKVASPEGIVNPALMSRQGTLFSNVIGNFVDYPIGVHTADYSGVLTKLSDKYFGSVVGAVRHLAYYEADPTNNTHAPLWAMNRRLWNRKKPVINYTSESVLFESGVLCQTPNGVFRLPSTTTSTQSFTPHTGVAQLCATENCGAMVVRNVITELNNLKFVSLTFYYEQGMYQLYYDMGVTSGSLGTTNGRIVMLSRDVTIETPDLPFGVQRENNNNSSEGTVYNGVACYRVPIENYLTIPSLNFRTQGNVEIVEQVIRHEDLHNQTAVCSYKLNVEGETDHLKVVAVPIQSIPNNYYIYIFVNNVKVICFNAIYLAILENKLLVISSSINVTLTLINTILETMDEETHQVEPINCYLYDDFRYILYSDIPEKQYKFRIIQN
ncbi:odv-e66 [Matsumuraeses phaseoli granulovirus]|uniref:Odv-e66 n=1 Tax=Matsumuraeses phaseoli granulovirus TaxID=2760664 RepID=A0AAE7MLD9_9BBAC|nr:odv-e66 [Matsumuraeses phaseoli granulovirus]QOD39994.1 odv-e66 [Matsumuraeses phaseoli granulovirus]